MIYNGYAGSYRNDHHDLMKFRFDDEKEQFLYCREDKKWKDTKYLSYQDHILAAVTKEEKNWCDPVR